MIIVAATSGTVEFAHAAIVIAALWRAVDRAVERDGYDTALWVLTSLIPAFLHLAFHGAVRWAIS